MTSPVRFIGDPINGETVVVVVLVVVLVVVVVVSFTASVLTVKVYELPYQRFGSPQQTPARNLYEPGSRTMEMCALRLPLKSSLAAIRLPDPSYSHK